MQTLGEIVKAFAAERSKLGPVYLHVEGLGAATLLALFGDAE